MGDLNLEDVAMDSYKAVMKQATFFFISLVLFSVSGVHASERLILKNGDMISGEILTSDKQGHLRLKTAYNVEFDIPLSQVKAVQSGVGVIFDSASQACDKSNNSGKDVMEDEPSAGSSEPFLSREDNPLKYQWSGRINLGASLDDGNGNKKAISSDAEIKARNAKNRWIFGGDVNFANDEGEETENDQSIYGEYNRFLSEKWFVGALQGFEIDKIVDLDLRSTTGPFMGYQFYERGDLNLRVRLGVNYIFEEFSSGDQEEDATAAWGFNYDQMFFDKAFTLFHNHKLDVPVEPVDTFLMESETGVRVPVGKYLTGTAQIDFDWDNAPAQGVREEDTKYSLKLGYEW